LRKQRRCTQRSQQNAQDEDGKRFRAKVKTL
jgi:hypothetical protein